MKELFHPGVDGIVGHARGGECEELALELGLGLAVEGCVAVSVGGLESVEFGFGLLLCLDLASERRPETRWPVKFIVRTMELRTADTFT